MRDTPEKKNWRQALLIWVNGEREPKDRTLFVMERRPPRTRAPKEGGEARERRRLRKFLRLYPLAAGLLCLAITLILLATVLQMPAFGQPGNPTNNEVSQHYLEHTQEETGAANAVTGMIISYRGFDTLGESCVLFLAVSSVLMLLWGWGEAEKRAGHAAPPRTPDPVLQQTARVLTPFVFLFAVYVLLNGESSPGGGFSGGTILGAGLILYANAFDTQRTAAFFNRRTFTALRSFALALYVFLYGYYIFMGANGLDNHIPLSHGGLILPIDLAVGLVVGCTVYGFYGLFDRGEI